MIIENTYISILILLKENSFLALNFVLSDFITQIYSLKLKISNALIIIFLLRYYKNDIGPNNQKNKIDIRDIFRYFKFFKIIMTISLQRCTTFL